MSRESGFTLVEVMAASLVTSVIVGGTFAAFIAASRMARAQNNPAITEAVGYAQQTQEHFRNKVAVDQSFFDDAAGKGWRDDSASLPASGGSESILTIGATRQYRVEKADCDNDGTTGDCYEFTSRVCWNDANCSN